MQEIDTGALDGFLETLCSLEGGTLVPELDRTLRDLVKVVKVRGGGGDLKVTLKLKQGETEGTMLAIPQIKVKEPEKRRMPTLLFTNEQNGLSQDKPEQTPLFSQISKGETV